MKFAKLALLAGTLAFALAPAQASEPIRIGVVGPARDVETGAGAVAGVQVQRSLVLEEGTGVRLGAARPEGRELAHAPAPTG